MKVFARPLLLLRFAVWPLLMFSVTASCGMQSAAQPVADTPGITKTLADTALLHHLHFAASVQRFYRQRNFSPAWVADTAALHHAWDALLLLDCVKQYGLHRQDFHPGELGYDLLKTIADSDAALPQQQINRFDVLLTDAMLTFANYVHFGRLNPQKTPKIIDNIPQPGFDAVAFLSSIVSRPGLAVSILEAQPQGEEYLALQGQLRLITGQYTGDCYETPEATVRLITINMERLRWYSATGQQYIRVNIPAYSLTYHLPDTVYTFKVVVGKPATPTPQLQSRIDRFTTNPDWRVPYSIFVKELLPRAVKDTAYLTRNQFAIYNNRDEYVEPSLAVLKKIAAAPRGYYARQSAGCDNALGNIIFRFSNNYGIYLHDTPQQAAFSLPQRALSHGCIRVQNPFKLASLILAGNGRASQPAALRQAIKNEQSVTFNLKKSVNFVVCYITCQVTDGQLTNYTDIYQLDRALEAAFYSATDTAALR